ncbi:MULTISPECIES: hypothetical protein [unclassified Romboutsia]|uniref:hypothetical protein n=1 Tax=unclassified Romboutsia TaxID=2626894 RepID=UPI0008211775|nr:MULTISPECIES: hypothetical protein [unclassified Romboutsia]SCH76839.1 Uncharacterised protein [uncultured Clostridium sp.]
MSKFMKITYPTYYSRYLNVYQVGKPESIDIIFIVEILNRDDNKESSFDSSGLRKLFDLEIDQNWFHKTLIKIGERTKTHAPLPSLPYKDVPFKPTLINLAENIFNIMKVSIEETFEDIKLVSVEVSTYKDSAIYSKN